MTDIDQCSPWKVVHRNDSAIVLEDPRHGTTRRYVVIDDGEDLDYGVYEHFTAYRFEDLAQAIEQAAACALQGLDGEVDDALADFDRSAPDAAERLKAVLEILKAGACSRGGEEEADVG